MFEFTLALGSIDPIQDHGRISFVAKSTGQYFVRGVH